jgi:cytochrome oxidase Cu insertion factor (SCO1/SenC/PrrC family)
MIKLKQLLRTAHNLQKANTLLVPSQVRHFSEGGEPPKKSAREAFEERQREKVQQKPEMDEKDETSFQDTNMGLKVLAYSVLVFGGLYFVHYRMEKLVKERKAMREGAEVELTEKDKINAVGGTWLLKDLQGRDFGSQNLYGTYYLLYFGFTLCPDICPLSVMKMTKAIRKIQQSKEGKQYYKVKSVFVTVNPELDKAEILSDFCSMYDKNLIPLRETSNSSENLQNMLRVFKVPVGLNETERQTIKDYFDRKKENEGRFEKFKFWKRKPKFDPLEGMMNDHSRVFYLMGADNRFLAFYPLDIEEKELV